MRILKWDFDCAELSAGRLADEPFPLRSAMLGPPSRPCALLPLPRGFSFEASNHNCKSACPRFTYLSHLIVQDSTYGAKALIPNIPSIPWHLSRALAG